MATMAKAFSALVLALALFATEGFLVLPQSTGVARSSVALMGARQATPLGRTSTLAGKEVRLLLQRAGKEKK